MRQLSICSVFILTVFIFSCQKSNSRNSGVASLTIVNANFNAPSIFVDFADTTIPVYRIPAAISFGSFLEYGLMSGRTPFTMISSADTTKTLLQDTFNLLPAQSYSMYLANNNSSADTFFMQDIIPFHTDSSAGVRFVNLLGDNQSVTINLSGSPLDQAEFSNLANKQATNFKSYPASNGISSYNFVIRNKAMDSLATASWNLYLFKNSTIVLCQSGAGTIQVFQVNNF